MRWRYKALTHIARGLSNVPGDLACGGMLEGLTVPLGP